MRKKIFFIAVLLFIHLALLGLPLYCATDDFSKISKLVQSFQIEPFQGSSATSVPITVPPGRRGVQPQINISYSSAMGNGWLGLGWDLSLGYIERVTNKGAPEYGPDDRFRISFLGINAELETLLEAPGEYYPKTTDFFIKLLQKGSYWEAYDKEGRKYIFGQHINSRIENSKGIFRWAFERVIDSCGNYMAVSYLKDESQVYPEKIEYTGNEATAETPAHKIEFILEDKEDVTSSFRSGYRVNTAKRLKEIKAYAGENLANRYLFEYIYSRGTGRSMLNKFTVFGSDNQTALPAMVFTYQDLNNPQYNITYTDAKAGNRLWYIERTFGFGITGGHTGKLYPKKDACGVSSFEGGGYVYWDFPSLAESGDFWATDKKGSLTVNLPKKTAFHAWTYVYTETAKTLSIPFTGTGNFFFWLNGDYTNPVDPQQVNLKAGSNLLEVTGYNADADFAFDLNYGLADNVSRMHSNQFVIPQLSGDFNGDGLMDLATYYASTGRIKVSLSQGNSFLPEEYWQIIPGDGFPKYMTAGRLNLLLGNFNGDFFTDIIGMNSSGLIELITSYGKAIFTDEGGGIKPFTVKGASFAADFNGDGITDLGLQAENSNDILILLCKSPNYYLHTGAANWLSNFPGKLLIGDFNGDGMADLASYNSEQAKISVALSKGNAFDAPQEWLNNFNPGSSPTTTDCNNDGLSDIAYFDKENGKIFTAASAGSYFKKPDEFLSGFSLKDPDTILQASDFNGDGISDFFVFNPYTQKTETAYSPFIHNDLLIKAENGIGGEVSIKYDYSGNYDNSISSDLHKEFEYRHWKGTGLPFSIPVVKEIDIADGRGAAHKSAFSYKNGFYDRNDREFRGFGYISSIDSEGNQKEIYFKQNDLMKGKPYNEIFKDAMDVLYLKVEKGWARSVENVVQLSTEAKFTYDGDATFKKSYVSFSYTYSYKDRYGQRQIGGDLKDYSEGGDSTVSRNRRIDYTPAGNSEYALVRPSYTDSGRASVVFSKKWMYYDNNEDFNAVPSRGLLTKEKIWLSSKEIPCSDPNQKSSSAEAAITTYSYDAYGNLISVTDPANHTNSIKYDPVYHIYPVEKFNALGHVNKSTYDPKTGKILSEIDANNQTTNYVYDTLGRLSKVIGPDDTQENPGIIYEYDLTSRPTKVTKRYKISTANVYAAEYSYYDGLGRLIQEKVPAENNPLTGEPRQIVKNIMTYNQQGKEKEKYNPYFTAALDTYSPPVSFTPKTTFEYDCLGRITKVINPDATSRTIEYSDWVQTKTDENGAKVRSTYNALNQLIKQEEIRQDETYVTRYEYDLNEYEPESGCYRKIFRIADHKNNITSVYYDLADRRVKMSDPDMGVWHYYYDKAGNLITQKDAKGQIIGFEYDATNRPTKKIYPDGKSIIYAYDDVNKPYCAGRMSSVTGLSGRTDYYYDNLGRQIKTTRTVDGRPYTIEHTYDPLGRTTQLTYPDSEIVNYEYNPQGIERVRGLGAAAYVTNTDYTATGQILKIDYGNGTTSEYTYDPKNYRLTDLRTNSGSLQDFHYKYDNAGNIAGITDYRNTATQDFLYDGLNRLTRAVGSYGSFTYEYDAIGNMVYKEGVSLGYGQNNAKPHAVTSGTDGFAAAYDANGNMLSTNDAVFTYDFENRLVKYESLFNNGSITLEIPLSEGWNFLSLPLIVNDNKITSALGSIEGKYDQVSRYNPSAQKFEHYVVGQPGYSQFDSLDPGKGYQIYMTAACALKITGRIPTANYDIPLSKGWQMMGYPSKNRVKAGEALSNLAKGTNYDKICKFDAALNTFVELSAQDYLEAGQSYFIRLIKNSTWSVLPKKEITEFSYDADGSRVKKVTNGSSTVYIDAFFEKDSGGETRKHIFAGENRIATLSLRGGEADEAISYYHSDHLGSSNVITDQNGQQVQHCEYAPYGTLATDNVIASPAGAKQSHISHYFTGKELDSTALYYYGARYYNPRIGRFITPDNFIAKPYNPQYLNRYSYCMNNPLRYIDPTGNFAQDPWSTPIVSDYGFSQGSGATPIISDYNNNGLSTFTQPIISGFQPIISGFNSFSPLFSNTFSSDRLLAATDSLNTVLASSFTQTAISGISKGGSAYFGEWTKTIGEWAPGWSRGIGRATGFQSAFQGLGLLQGSLKYFDIMDRVFANDLSPVKGYAAIWLHTVGMIAKVGGTEAGKMGGIALVKKITGGPGTTWGGVGGAVIGGTIMSFFVDALEQLAFRYLEIE